MTTLWGGEHVVPATIAHAQGGVEELPVRGLFVLIGADPYTAWLGDILGLDEHGFILTGQEVATAGAAVVLSPFQTRQPGIFAVGDVRSGSVKRVASAVGEEAVVIQAVHRYLAEDGHGAERRRDPRHSEPTLSRVGGAVSPATATSAM